MQSPTPELAAQSAVQRGKRRQMMIRGNLWLHLICFCTPTASGTSGTARAAGRHGSRATSTATTPQCTPTQHPCSADVEYCDASTPRTTPPPASPLQHGHLSRRQIASQHGRRWTGFDHIILYN